MSLTAPRGKMNNAFDPSTLEQLDDSTRSMIERRVRLLGPAYRLFYKHPVEFVRASGVHLYDRDGNEYLDAYNNVVSVGHSHPRVVAAISEQLGTLCTHTRYLQEGILDFAEELLASFGGSLSQDGHAMFTCTGSEANDLALRIAQHHTGARGLIVTSEAYHGNSYLTAGISPALGKFSPLGEFVHTVRTPDSYRLTPSEVIARFSADVAAAIRDIESRGERLAAFVVDSMFSSDGVFSHPTELLAPVVDLVHKAGGFFVADEVQCGFARSGEALWGYQRHGIDPDIATMGKPMGNGYPVAGIAVRHHIVETFGSDSRYFNTFGGNTVAIAAAQAVWNVIKDEGLQENSRTVGLSLAAGLQELATRHEAIGDVRGSGMYYGVEIVADRATKLTDPALTTAIVNGLRERRVLISATGEDGSVLKIRPPLVFSEANAARLVSALDEVLTELA